MSANELPNDPADLLDELDSIIREQEVLKRRASALTARYRSLEGYADRFDKPGRYSWLPEEFGSVNVEATVNRLADPYMDAPLRMLYSAREYAEKVREYLQTERDQAEGSQVEEPVSAPYQRIAESSALAGYQPGQALADRAESDRGDR